MLTRRNVPTQIIALVVGITIAAIPIPFRANVLDSDMQQQKEYLYTSTICRLDKNTNRTVLSTRGRALIGKDIILAGYLINKNGITYVTNMPGLNTSEDLRYLGVFEVPLEGNPGLLEWDDTLTTVSIEGQIEFVADNDYSFYAKTVSNDGIIVPRHTTEYLLFNWQNYTSLIGYIDDYYVIIKDKQRTEVAIADLQAMTKELGSITYKDTGRLREMFRQLILCYKQPELIDKQFISRSEQLSNFKVILIEELIKWGSLHGEKLGFTQ